MSIRSSFILPIFTVATLFSACGPLLQRKGPLGPLEGQYVITSFAVSERTLKLCGSATDPKDGTHFGLGQGAKGLRESVDNQGDRLLVIVNDKTYSNVVEDTAGDSFNCIVSTLTPEEMLPLPGKVTVQVRSLINNIQITQVTEFTI